MGSLPNLDHQALERRQERAKEKELARERAREREFCHDPDSWRERTQSMQTRQNQRPIMPQRRVIRTRSSGNTHHLTDEPLENLSFLTRPGPLGSSTKASTTTAAAVATVASAKSHKTPPQQRTVGTLHQHPNTLPSLPPSSYALGHHPVLSAQSSGNNAHHHQHFYHNHHHNIIQAQSSNPMSRRRESANSSVGSVRRLLAVNRGCRHKIPVHVRAKVVKNFIFLVISHGLISATLLPLICLQASNSIWVGVRQSYSSIVIGGSGLGDNSRGNMTMTMPGMTTANQDDTRDNINGSTMSGAAAAVALSSSESGDSNNDNMFMGNAPADIGSLLLCLTFLLTSGTCFLTALAIKKAGHYLVILSGYVSVAIFLAAHFLPTTYFALLPAYLLLGVVCGPLCISKLNLVLLLANKLSCGEHECCNALSTPTQNPSAIGGLEGPEDNLLFATKSSCSRDENIRRLARWYHAVQNFGFICGAIVVYLLLTCSAFHPPNSSAHSQCLGQNRSVQLSPYSTSVANDYLLIATSTSTETPVPLARNTKESGSVESMPPTSGDSITTAPIAEALLTLGMDSASENFDTNSHGQRICGSASCPVWWVQSPVNGFENPYTLNSIKGTSPNYRLHGTIALYLSLALMAVGFTVGIGQFSNRRNTSTSTYHKSYRYNAVPGLVDTLFFAGPMAYFIGTEQGYILGDFMKAFVSCSIGPHMVAGALIGMGIMQLIASCTLSMLLRHTKRLVVIIAGSFFHACLLLVLSRWKPSSDDSALFYVIAAAWGVCHAVWDTLLFTLMSLTHKNHMLEVLTPIHGIQYLAMGVTFGAHGFLCEYAKIIVLAILLIVSVPPYTSLEMRLEAQRKATKNNKVKSVLQIPTL